MPTEDDGGQYVRSFYGVPAHVGVRVDVGEPPDTTGATVVGFTRQYVKLALDGVHGRPGMPEFGVYHPTWRIAWPAAA